MKDYHDRLSSCPALNLTFRDLTYTLPAKKGGGKKDVLHGVSGHILSGRLTAILGSSGAGKTSLVNVLAGAKTKGVRGQVLVNGVQRSMSEFRWQSSYITQDVYMLEDLSTEETLHVAAKFKLANYTRRIGRNVVTEILELLNLNGCRNTFVVNLSGGEKKRLSIGVELITNPPIMFFDEPTSGLDSVSAVQVVTHLQSLARSGRAVACVIHQPSSKLCHMFDDIILMSDGYILYSGPMDEMVPALEEAGFSYPTDYNRADFALEVACKERGDDLSKLLEKFNPSILRKGDDHFMTSTEETKMLSLELSDIAIDGKDNNVETKIRDKVKRKIKTQIYATSQWRQFIVILERSMRTTIRDKYLTQLRILIHIVVGLLLGTLCYNVGNEASKIFTNCANLFFFSMFIFFVTSMSNALLFPKEMNVLIREMMNNWYSLPAYFAAKCVTNIPLQLLCPTIFIVIAYFLTGQPAEVYRFFITWLITTLVGIAAQGLGMTFGTALGGELGIFMIPGFSVPMILFSGFFVQLPDIPSSLRWLAEISIFKHGFEATLGVIYGHNRSTLHCSQVFCFFKYPAKFLGHLDIKEENLLYNFTVLMTWIVSVHILLYLVTVWRIRSSR